MNQPESNSGLTVNHYLVLFLDVLGQREALRKLPRLVEMVKNEQDKERYASEIMNAVGPVFQVQEHLVSYFEGFFLDRENSLLPAEIRPLFKPIRKNILKFQRFSDGIVGFVPLNEELYRFGPIIVFSLLAACSSMLLLAFASKFAVRGGIEIGAGLEWQPGEIYGPVVSTVADLESQKAQYPRIVVGKELLSFLSAFQGTDHIDPVLNVATSFKEQCFIKFLKQDLDGLAFVDFLGEGFRSIAGTALDSKVILPAYEFVKESCARFKKEQNTKLSFRYSILERYFRTRLPLWGLNP